MSTFEAMSRILALDYGSKRCGLAISDPLGMIANALPTLETRVLLAQLPVLYREYQFSTLVVGEPLRASGEHAAVEEQILLAIEKIRQLLPGVEVVRFDERYTSKIAMQTLIRAGATKKQRRDKGMIDKVSAALILQDYLNSR